MKQVAVDVLRIFAVAAAMCAVTSATIGIGCWCETRARKRSYLKG